MAVLLAQHIMSALPELRFQPTAKRVRVARDGVPVADTTRARLVWEPRRIVPSYAVPVDDLLVPVGPAAAEPVGDWTPVEFGDDRGLLDPHVPFAVHTADGEPVSLAGGAAFRLTGDLDGYVVLDFDAFDWREEDEPLVGHPRDPFHRIDVRPSSRRVRISHDGVTLAESDRARFLFEGAFPMARYYLPREDVVAEIVPGTRRTTCAYKGHATHWTVGGLPDIAWSYEDPLEDAASVRGLIAFYHERLDVTIDGEPLARVRTPWS